MGRKKKEPDKSEAYLEYIEKYKKSQTSLKTNKTSLKSVVKNSADLLVLNDIVLNVNKIRIHTYHFLKLYVLHNYFHKNGIPEISVSLINTIMKVICLGNKTIEKKIGKPMAEEKQKVFDEINKFYKEHYSKIIGSSRKYTYEHLNTVLDYESQTIYTNFCNHIQNNFYVFFNRYINVMTDKIGIEEEVNSDPSLKKPFKELLIRNFRKDINELKKDILLNEDNSKGHHSTLKYKFRNNYLPKTDSNKSLVSQVSDDPLAFLECLIKMNLEIDSSEQKTINCFPLQKSIIPNYIRIDTTTLIHCLFKEDDTEEHKKSFYLKDGNTLFYKDYIWDKFFRTGKKEFNGHRKEDRKKYIFNNQIMTDGVGCSILLIRKDLHKKGKKIMLRTMRKPFGYTSEKYIEDLTNDEKMELQHKIIIGVDPGKDDLLYATNGNTQLDYVLTDDQCSVKRVCHNTESFRYSQNQRRKEMKTKKYRDIKLFAKESPAFGSFTVQEIEDRLTYCNFNSCNYDKVKDDLYTKNLVNSMLIKHYETETYRKLKWYSFINKQKSESKMINNFKKKFGDHKDTIVCIGDWEQRKQMKFKEPTIGKGLRKIFQKAHYKTFLVYERNTSKYNFITGDINEKFRYRKNPKPNQENERLQHGLLRSKNVTNYESCSDSEHILVNRDLNGAYNIRLKAYNIIHNIQLPFYLDYV